MGAQAIVRSAWAGSVLQRVSHAAERRLAQLAYQAAQWSQFRKLPARSGSADAEIFRARGTLRDWCRHLDENHDITVGILDTLVNNVVGEGFSYKPMVKRLDGSLAEQTNEALQEAWREWARRPDMEQGLPLGELERMIARSTYRDGDVFEHHLVNTARYRYPSPVRYAIEALESDYLPYESDPFGASVMPIERDEFRVPRVYNFYVNHPGNLVPGAPVSIETIAVPASRITHIRFSRRLQQGRGVPLLTPAIVRIDDLEDYEKSERLAARVAAYFCAMIQRSVGWASKPTTDPSKRRQFQMRPGTIFDELLPGETVQTIDSKRPNPGLAAFMQDQLRRLASGSGTAYSSIAKHYDNSYSAARQELLEAFVSYRRHQNYLIGTHAEGLIRQFVTAAILGNTVGLQPGVDTSTLLHWHVEGPTMPHIDTKNEIDALVAGINAGIDSGDRAMRTLGRDPEQVRREREQNPPVQQAAPVATPSPAPAPASSNAA